MLTDTLQEALLQIERYASENNIPLFYGDTVEDYPQTVLWEGKNPGDWKGYLSLIPPLGTKILHVEINRMEVPEGEELEVVQGYAATLEGEELSRWQASWDAVQEANGLIITLDLTFYHEGVAYLWSEGAEWGIHRYRILPPEPWDSEGEDDDAALPSVEDLKILEEVKRLADKNKLHEEEAEEFLENEEYLAAVYVNDRRSVVVRTLVGKDPRYRVDAYRIAAIAEEKYKKEVLVKKEAALIEKINSMRAQNPKLTKTVAAGIIGISPHQMNHYWHKTENPIA